MIVSFPTLSACSCLLPPLQPELGEMTGKWLCLLLDRSARKFQSENKRKTERKLFIREHQLQCSFLFSASLFSLPSSEFLFHLFHCSFFSLRQFLSLSLPLLLAILFLLPLASVCCRHRFLPPSLEI